MAGFENHTITAAGLAALAQATVLQPIHFTKLLASSTYYEPQNVTIADLEIEGTIASAGAAGNVSRVVGALSGADEDGEIIKTVGLVGYINDPNNEILISAASDAASTMHTSSLYASYIGLEFGFDELTPGTFTSSSGAFVIQSDLDRFVSMHAAGDLSAGEDQTILGHKTFAGNVTITGYLSIIDIYCETISAVNDDIYIGTEEDALSNVDLMIRLDTTITGHLTASSASFTHVTLSSTLTVGASISCGGALSVDGNATIDGTALVGGGLAVTDDVSAASFSGVLTSLYGTGRGALVRLRVSLTGSSGSSGAASLSRGDIVADGQTVHTTGVDQALVITSSDIAVTSSTRFALLHAIAPSYSGLTSTSVEVDAIVTSV